MKLNRNFIQNDSGLCLDSLFGILAVLWGRLDAMRYNRPWWRAGRRCRGDGGVPIVLAAAYDRPGWGTRVGDGKDCGGSGYDRPGWGSLFCSSASRGVSTTVMFVAVLFWSFVWPWRRM